MAICKGCGRPIEWVRTANGKMMPVDPQLVGIRLLDGGSEMLITIDGETVRGRRCDPDADHLYNVGYVPHWPTCPARDHFKRGGKEQ